MEKKIKKRYHSEEAVKKALKIESFRNLTKDKVMEFTSMIPYMEKEVALEIIKQFPVYVEFVESAIENYTQLCKTILETNKAVSYTHLDVYKRQKYSGNFFI